MSVRKWKKSTLSCILPIAVYAVYAHRQYLSAKVRTFVDFLDDYFGSPPYWECE